ncbi:hypothetical protein PHYBLDRAFT_142435 [Phycomyces blakesleeanus NRRL 1555(-)]|uniref:Uncharacterized protein n=1 Tax=Phycomyces blakesleeanus (strain ATCC 8743b / DSM 1359 / FGSC 10004 / NBRC 33097 / NRRL 1555) TaxID=763407 RepID=A0A167NZ67_PHYB8|nr:hypothetical protein PHYBLDRAFT_142435 [Phycomyces blakesleeanus NRRL 1555(-)]OAD76928.1 hypothetical protein PHYBLDRAFT_142435 [Phycomyces blakesleeanus NRRL 1555(-)]|eukprot:XP_018294968.1 hypothetical protein PHYBLDRAFT_142435 [Phycomyces blakesleeanus NRRL 1555(-)]
MLDTTNGVEVCCAKIHLLLASDDIPAVDDMAHIGSHASLFGCQICETKGKPPDNRWHGIELSAFSRSSFFALDELHLVARGIRKHIYDLITVSLTKETKYFYTHPDDTLSTTEYPFFIPRTSPVTFGNCITSSRPYIPVLFHGSFDNVFSKIDDTHAVNQIAFLLYIVPTLVVPFLSNRAVQTAVHFKHWHRYLLQQVQNKTISRSVFRPVQHYLVHISFIVKQLGPLRCYSTRSMERVIDVFSKLIKSKCKGNHNASFLVERFTLHNYVNTAISIQNEIDLIQPKPYGRESYMDLPNNPSGVQFNRNIIVYSWLVGAVVFFFQHDNSLGSLYFFAFVEVMKEHDVAAHDSSVPIVKQQSQNSSTGRQTQPTYAVISVNDICHQFGLTQYPPNGNQFYVIAPYYVFSNNMRITKGNLSIL